MALKAAANASVPAAGQMDPAPGSAAPSPRVGFLILFVLTAGALLLRILHLTSRSFTLDEGFSIFLARTSFAEFARTIWNGELNMALYYAALRLWVHLSSSEFAIRILSVAFGVATVIVVCFLGLRLFSRRAGIVAAVLMLVHPAHIALSQDARSYSLTVLLVSLSSLLFLRTLQHPSFPSGIGYATVSAFAVYSHFFAMLVILAQVLSLLFTNVDPRTRKILLMTALLLAVLTAPIALFLARGPRLELAWVPTLHAQQFSGLLYFLTLSRLRCLTYLGRL